MRKSGFILILALALTLTGLSLAFGWKSDMEDFNNLYFTEGTRLDDCTVCHQKDREFFTDYGQDYQDYYRNFELIQAHDSDGDGFTNIEEIEALTFPGDPDDMPAIPNEDPVADAGPDQDVDEDVDVTLDGSNSMDPENSIKSFLWTQIDGPAVTLSDPNADSPTFISPDVGPEGVSLTFELTITDDGDLM